MAEKNNITELSNGLHSDTSMQSQPKGTYRFALNAVNETELGDEFFISNEESNEPYIQFPNNYIPIGKVYIGHNETAIFLVSLDNLISEIGIVKNNSVYETHVNDQLSLPENKLNFNVKFQIQGTFRLRFGCEKTIYFTDNNQKPRYYNFNKADDFKINGQWIANKFNLIKQYSLIPEFKKIEVLDSGGELEPGSQNISIEYLDKGFNSSGWITTTNTVNIYNDSLTKSFLDINGSINSSMAHIDFPTTSKSIKVEVDNLDPNYPFYRLAFIEASSGNGFVNKVSYTAPISIDNKTFIYTGKNAETVGTKEEILFFNNTVYKAGSIEQIENKLLLLNTQGKQTNYCKLQKYASKIKADVVTKKIILNNVFDPSNTKNPTVHFGDMTTGGTGCMPGEIYSYGIVYVYDDGAESPSLHIPGKNPDINSETIFDPGINTYPMDNVNENLNTVYLDDDTCNNNDFWGLDSEGVSLKNKPVRHHRFPLRSKLNLPLVKEESSSAQSFLYYVVNLTGVGNLPIPVNCAPQGTPSYDPSCVPTFVIPFQVKVTYTIDGVLEQFVTTVNPSENSNPATIIANSSFHTSNVIVIVKIEEIGLQNDGITPYTTNVTSGVSPKGLTYTTSIVSSTINTQNKIYSTKILGIKFSGIEMPSLDDTNGQKIIGYYIVKNERTEFEKTILDSGVIVPTIENDKYVAQGLLSPDIDFLKVNKNVFGLIHPEHKFNNKEITDYDYIRQEGTFDVIKKNISKTHYNDVLDGSTYNAEVHEQGSDDGTNSATGLDGFGLTIISRDSYLKYTIKKLVVLLKNNITDLFYLDALESRSVNNGQNTIYNIAADNKIGIIHASANLINPDPFKLPYVILCKNLTDSYSDFRNLPYYKESLNLELFTELGDQNKTSIFNGDTYVCPMRYTNTLFWDNRSAFRVVEQSGFLQKILVPALFIVGLLLAIPTAGASLSLIAVGAGLLAVGTAVLLLSSGIKRDNFIKAYSEEYKRGLRVTALDRWVDAFYNYTVSVYTFSGIFGFGFLGNGGRGESGPSDDEIQYVGDTLTDIWFESSVNISLRNKMNLDLPTFLDAPGVAEVGNNSRLESWEFFGSKFLKSLSRYPVSKLDIHLNRKLLGFNPNRKDNREYLGAPLGEYYNVNPDYHRINKEKIFYGISLEYDCCSECQESFPHRWHWSEQSFQEELTDNYRIFLPNNYKDIEGETGKITNAFKIGNDLFIHTEEALYQIPRNYQERVTDQIVSFIGSGSYGELPARKIIDDDNGSSAGSQHKWATIKTPAGVFFISENQKKIYQFDGSQLKPISNLGLSNWFKEKTELAIDKTYYNATGKLYPYSDNPSNILGSGFISTYDTKKERIIFTKKDFTPTQEYLDILQNDIILQGNTVLYSNNQLLIINARLIAGWSYLGIEDDKLKFSKVVTTTTTELVPTTTCVTECSDPVYKSVYYLTVQDNTNPVLWKFNWSYTDAVTLDTIVGTGSIIVGCNIVGIIAKATDPDAMFSTTVNISGQNITQAEICEQSDCVEVCTTILVPTQTTVFTTQYEFENIFSQVNVTDLIENNNSWTLSYSIKNNSWISWHSYLPNFYINVPENFYSWNFNNNTLWKHNKKENYQSYYGTSYPFVLESVLLSNPLITKIFDYISFLVEVKKFNAELNEYVDIDNEFFNKLIAYNSKQCSGLLNIKVKDANELDNYLLEQVTNIDNNEIVVDRNEKNWTINELRDIRVNYNEPLFTSDLNLLQNNYYIDKILNSNTIDYNKDWSELESFRDKYLVVRLIFDNFADASKNKLVGETKIIMNYSSQNESPSFR